MMGMAGGSSGFFKKVEIHSVTITGITQSNQVPASVVQTINHQLGEIPDFILLYPKTRFIPEYISTKTTYTTNSVLYMGVGASANSGVFDNGYSSTAQNYIRGDNGTRGTTASISKWINNITSTSIRLGGILLYNSGIINGDYWCIIGKINDTYVQGEQTIYDE